MSIPATQEEFRQFFGGGSASISLAEADAVVASLSAIELTDDEVRNKFWREFRPLTMVGRALGFSGISIRYTGLTNQQFDAVLFDAGAGEHIVECVTIDRLGRHYQAELINRIKSKEDGSWNPRQIVLKRTKSGQEHYIVISPEEIPSAEAEVVGACSPICSQFYRKLRNECRVQKDGRRISKVYIEYYVFSSYEPPLAYLEMIDDFRNTILLQLHLLSSLTDRRLFFVGWNHVIDSEMQR